MTGVRNSPGELPTVLARPQSWVALDAGLRRAPGVRPAVSGLADPGVGRDPFTELCFEPLPDFGVDVGAHIRREFQ